MVNPKQVKVYIEKNSISLSLKQIKYVFRILLKNAGFAYGFIKKKENADIVYGNGKYSSKLIIKQYNSSIQKKDKHIIEEKGLPFIVFGKSSKDKKRVKETKKSKY